MSYWFSDNAVEPKSKARAATRQAPLTDIFFTQADSTIPAHTRKPNYFTSVTAAQQHYPHYQPNQSNPNNTLSRTQQQRPAKKCDAAAQVLATAKRNDEAQHRISELKQHVIADQISQWFSRKDKGQSLQEHSKNLLKQQQEARMNKEELQRIRQYRLKELFETEEKEQQQELANRGLSTWKE